MPTLMQLFGQGYDIGETMTREYRARGAAKEKFGAAADNPALFNQLEQGVTMQANRRNQAARLEMAQSREQRAQQKFDTEQSTVANAQKRAATMRLINGLRAARDRGEDIGAAFDRMRPAIEEMGVPPADIPGMRQQLIDDPDVLDEYYNALVGPQTPGEAADVRSSKSSADSAEDRQAAMSELQKLDDVTARIDRLEAEDRQDAAKSVFGLPGLSGVFQGGFGAMGSIPGSAAAGYVADLEALDGDIRSQAFETLKGGGQITEKESEFARAAIANLSRNMPYPQYRQELRDLRDYMERLKAAARARLNGEDVPDIAPPGGRDPRTVTQDSTQEQDTGPQIYPGYVDPESGMVFEGGDPGSQDSWKVPE